MGQKPDSSTIEKAKINALSSQKMSWCAITAAIGRGKSSVAVYIGSKLYQAARKEQDALKYYPNGVGGPFFGVLTGPENDA